MAKDLPEELVVGVQTWKLMDPGLYMRNHIGEITTPDGTVYDISGSLNGLSVYLETPYEHPRKDEVAPKQIIGKAMYMLSPGETLKLLVQALEELPDA